MKRFKKLLKWIAIGLLLVVSIVILVFAFHNWRASRAVESRLTPLREAGKPVSISELAASPIADDVNAASVIKSLKDTLTEFESQLASATRETETDEQYDAAAIEVARRISQEHPKLAVRLRKAARLPDYQPTYDFSLGPTELMDQIVQHTGPVRNVARVLRGHGLLSLADRQADDAALDAIAIAAWSRHQASEPVLINYLVGVALFGDATDLAARCLYSGDLTPEIRSQLLRAMKEDSFVSSLGTAIDTERAFGISSFDSFPGSRFQFMLGELSSYLDLVVEFKLIAAKPTGIAPSSPQTQSMFGGLTWPAMSSGLAALRRVQAQSRAIQILAAWQPNEDNPTNELKELNVSESIKIDPFDGLPMKFKTMGDAISVYSVGPDLVDDDGTLEDSQDIGVTP